MRIESVKLRQALSDEIIHTKVAPAKGKVTTLKRMRLFNKLVKTIFNAMKLLKRLNILHTKWRQG